MHAIEVEGRSVGVGSKGFVENFADWDEEVARAMAAQEGLELGECHWKAIHFIRQYYQEYEIPPSPRVMIHEVGEQLSAVRCSYKTLKQLFPNGGCKQACRLAGLPTYYCYAC